MEQFFSKKNFLLLQNLTNQTKSMTFFTLQQLQKTLTIRNKKRISLIVPYSYSQLIIFYQDCSFEHRQLFNNKIIHEGKLQFVVTSIVKPAIVEGCKETINEHKQNHVNKIQYLCLIGQKDDFTVFGIFNVASELYEPYEMVVFSIKREVQCVNFHLVTNSISTYPFLVMVSMNVQNGIMIECFDFLTKKWFNDVLYLGSRFLSYHFLSVPRILSRQGKTSFCLIANGQKSQSVHIACISIYQEVSSKEQEPKPVLVDAKQSIVSKTDQSESIPKNPEEKTKKIQFVFTKEIKYYRNFTILGGHIISQGHLFLIGNSLSFQTKEQKSLLWQPNCLYFNFENLLDNLDSQYKFVPIQNFTIGREIIVRQFLGFVENSISFIVENPTKRSLHKLTPKMILQKRESYDEEIHVFSCYKPQQIQISNDSMAFMSFQLVCEQFFEKIKDSPSVIKLNLLIKISKKIYYKHILENAFEQSQNDENFIRSVLDCF